MAVATGEWVGGRARTAAVVTGEGDPYRVEVILWMESPHGAVVGHHVVDPSGPPATLADTLREAMNAR